MTSPAEHWKHLRTTNVTVRHRTVRSKGCLPNKTALAMVKLAEAAEKIGVASMVPKIILGIKFTDGIEVVRSQAQIAAAGTLPSPRFGDSSYGELILRVCELRFIANSRTNLAS
jgi:hypothetical protein